MNCRHCPKASQRLLDDSAFDIEGWLAGRIADKFARAEAASFIINGDGVDKPKGFLAHTSVDNEVWAWGNLGYVPTGVQTALSRRSRSSSWSMLWVRPTVPMRLS